MKHLKMCERESCKRDKHQAQLEGQVHGRHHLQRVVGAGRVRPRFGVEIELVGLCHSKVA